MGTARCRLSSITGRVVSIVACLALFLHAGLLGADPALPEPAVESVAQAPAQERTLGSLAFGLWPGVNVPLGPAGAAVNKALSGEFGARFHLQALPLFAGIDVSYTHASLVVPGSITSLSGFASIGASIPVTTWLRAVGSGFVGYGYSRLIVDYSDSAAGALGYGGSAGVEFPITSVFALGLRLGFLAHANTYSGLRLSAGTVVSLPPITVGPREPREPRTRPTPMPLETAAVPAGMELALDSVAFDTIFPVFYKYYDSAPVGRAILMNIGNRPVSDISIRLHVPRFMDVARTQTVPPRLAAGESIELDLYGLLTDEILRVTEGTKVAVTLDVSYSVNGTSHQYSLDRTLEVANRNAMTWDDDRKAASFVTARDPVVLTMARNVASIVRSEGFDAINLNVRNAIAMADAIDRYGVRYVIDPTSPYAELSGQAHAVDFLQFPRQTLEYRAGDCDDLSILYAALLEAVGVPTAFITVPGHIYTAFSTGLPVAEARNVFSRADEIIDHDGTAWIPVETTILDQGFLQAWQTGARQWREHSSRGQAELYPIADAWQVYPAVGLPDSPPSLTMPAATALAEGYRSQLTRFIDREIFPQVSRLQSQISASGNDPRQVNRLGVLYARYGLTDRARREFERIAAGTPPYAPAVLNLGNLHFLAKNIDRALEYYERASDLSPDNAIILLALARANHELENYGLVARTYGRLKE
ncbi:MAG: hypothetical protein EA426_00775, partial [Spirochaetaceae bacterium]